MTLQNLPTAQLDDPNHRRRHRELTNLVLQHQHDDSRVRTRAEVAASVTPVNYAFAPEDPYRFKAASETDDSVALQTVYNVAKSSGGLIRLMGRHYNCETAIDWRRDSTGDETEQHYVIDGGGAILDFRNSGITSGALVSFGTTSQANSQEAGKYVLRNLIILGPESSVPDVDDTPDTSTTGLLVEFALGGCVLENVHVKSCFKGYKFNFCFPIDAKNVISQNCYVGLHLTDCTTATWKDCGFRNGRFGILLAPDSSTAVVMGQKFLSVNLEGNKVGCAMDPEDGSGFGVRNIQFENPYLEAIALDGFRFGREVDVTDAAVKGADRTRDCSQLEWSYGTWDAGGSAWGSSNHDALLGQSTTPANRPYSIILRGVPVADGGMDLRGCKDITFLNAKDGGTGSTADNFQALSGYAFVSFDPDGAIGAGKTMYVAKNVQGVEKTAAPGEWQVSFTRSYKSASSYVCVATCEGGKRYAEVSARSATVVTIRTYDDTGTLSDPTDKISVACFGIE
jgi:hypothetical protein